MRREFGQFAYTHLGVNADEVGALVGVGGGERPDTPFIGVRALMLAMLEDAIRAYLGPPGPSHDEAGEWIADSRCRWVFSFPSVCETLALEPGAVRAAVFRMRRRSAPMGPLTIGRSRPNSRRQAGLHIGVDSPRAARRLVDEHKRPGSAPVSGAPIETD